MRFKLKQIFNLFHYTLDYCNATFYLKPSEICEGYGLVSFEIYCILDFNSNRNKTQFFFFFFDYECLRIYLYFLLTNKTHCSGHVY